MVAVNQLFEDHGLRVDSVEVYGHPVTVKKWLTRDEYDLFVSTITEHMKEFYGESEFLAFRLLWRMNIINFYTYLCLDSFADNLLEFAYESGLYEKIIGANGEHPLINMAQYNEMLEDIKDALKPHWEMESSDRMIRFM